MSKKAIQLVKNNNKFKKQNEFPLFFICSNIWKKSAKKVMQKRVMALPTALAESKYTESILSNPKNKKINKPKLIGKFWINRFLKFFILNKKIVFRLKIRKEKRISIRIFIFVFLAFLCILFHIQSKHVE